MTQLALNLDDQITQLIPKDEYLTKVLGTIKNLNQSIENLQKEKIPLLKKYPYYQEMLLNTLEQDDRFYKVVYTSTELQENLRDHYADQLIQYVEIDKPEYYDECCQLELIPHQIQLAEIRISVQKEIAGNLLQEMGITYNNILDIIEHL